MKYLFKLDDKISKKVVDDAMASYAKFIWDVEEYDTVYEDGELTCSYTVTVNSTRMAEWLKGEGIYLNVGPSGSEIKIIVMEEPPAVGMIQLGEEMENFFLKRYSEFQRTIREVLIAEVEKYGLKVDRLENDKSFAEFKKVDPNLVGVSYDVNSDTRGFVVPYGFLGAVQGSNPYTIALSYRINGLTYNPATRQMRISVALKLMNLADDTTKNLGSCNFAMASRGSQSAEIMMDFCTLVERALIVTFHTQDVGQKITKLVQEMRKR